WEKMLSVFAPKGKASSHSAGVVVVDGQGNMAAVNHTINAVLWGSTGIFVDGVSIPDSAASEQSKMARIKPGDRLPETTNPVIVLKNDKPYLASSSIGYALLQTTMSNLVNVLDFSMDLKKSIDTPNFLGFYLGNFIGGGPVPQIYMEV